MVIFQQELKDDSSLRLLFTDEFTLVFALFRYRENPRIVGTAGRDGSKPKVL
jgi:hypothetical protein